MDYTMKMKTHMPTYKRNENYFTHGEGSWLFDHSGEKYLDFVSGIAVNSLGHSPEALTHVIKEQSDKLLHISNLYWNQPQMDLTYDLIEKSNHKDVFLCNSGAEAVEGALKLARKYGKSISPDKNQIVYFKNSFHGRTMGSLSVTSNANYQNVATPLVPQAIPVSLEDNDEIKSSINNMTCAVIVEPIQGEGGIITVPQSTLKLIKELCIKNDALLIFDEVQCGIGRTGSFFAYENTQVIPDIVCLAKGLGGGLPIGAVVANEKASVFTPGDHGTTFGGNPLVSAVAHTVINIVGKKEFLNEVTEKGHYIMDAMNNLKEKYPVIGEIKGKGLLIGIDLAEQRNTVISMMYDEKVLLVGAGSQTMRILPPLNVSYMEIDHFIEKFEKVISKLA